MQNAVMSNVSKIDSYRYKPRNRITKHISRTRHVSHTNNVMSGGYINRNGWRIPTVLYLLVSICLLMYSLTTKLYKNNLRSQEWKILFFASNMLIILLYTMFLYLLCKKGYYVYAWLFFVSHYIMVYIIILIFQNLTSTTPQYIPIHKQNNTFFPKWKKQPIIHNPIPNETQIFNYKEFGPINTFEQKVKSYKDYN
jgi:hypothetical protein